MTLRPPNFSLSEGPSHHSTAATANYIDNNRPTLSSYTSKCQQQLLLAVSKSIDDGSSDDDDVILPTKDGAKNDTNNKGSHKNREGSNEPSMEQCILLLESHLAGFQRSCRQKKEQRHSNDLGGKKAKKRKKAHSTNEQQQERPRASLNSGSNENEKGINEEEEEDDEVPPQLLRLARFFHYRWLPIKRALLRPIQHSANATSSNSNEEHQTTSPPVEVGLKYRLRLAKACWKHGLVAAAEYEMLIASLNKVLEPTSRCSDRNDDINGEMKSRSQNDAAVDEDNLMERVRLALLRLPTDANISSTVSTSSPASLASATAAWRHTKEMILECCRNWEKNDITVSMMLLLSASVAGEDSERYNELISKHGISDVVDWALTSWTGLLLSQGVDCYTATSSSTLVISNSNDPISRIEKEFATMLSNRSQSIGNSNDPNPFLLFAMAVSNRINEILTYRNLKRMRGIQVLSMARLLAMFHSRENAEEHIITSIITCSAVKGGGMDCADSLSRLLAIYCCNISIADGNAAPTDSLVGKTANRTTAADLECRLRGKLNDEFVKRVVSSIHKEEGLELKQRDMVVSTAKSFMNVIFSMTAHFIKCGGRN